MDFSEVNCCHMCGCDSRPQRHVHEIVGRVEIAEENTDPHNHRFATVSGEAIPLGNGDHVHEVCFRTDFYENHFHEFHGRSGGAIDVAAAGMYTLPMRRRRRRMSTAIVSASRR